MLKLPDYFSIYALMKEDGAVIVETDTAEEDHTLKSAGLIVVTIAAIVAYCVRRAKGAFTADALCDAVKGHLADPTIHWRETDVPTSDELYSDNPTQEKKEPDPFEGMKLPKFTM